MSPALHYAAPHSAALSCHYAPLFKRAALLPTCMVQMVYNSKSSKAGHNNEVNMLSSTKGCAGNAPGSSHAKWEGSRSTLNKLNQSCTGWLQDW
eukprot:1138057-Pelagomonas_calceolata.AAC.5